MAKSFYGPLGDWRTFAVCTDGISFRDFKAEWYRLYRDEGVSSDVIIRFKNNEVKLCSANIYWGNISNPANYKFFLDGSAAGKVFGRIESIAFMHPIWNHPECGPFWKKDESGEYKTFDYRGAKPVVNRVFAKLVKEMSVQIEQGVKLPSLDEQIANSKVQQKTGATSVRQHTERSER